MAPATALADALSISYSDAEFLVCLTTPLRFFRCLSFMHPCILLSTCSFHPLSALPKNAKSDQTRFAPSRKTLDRRRILSPWCSNPCPSRMFTRASGLNYHQRRHFTRLFGRFSFFFGFWFQGLRQFCSISLVSFYSTRPYLWVFPGGSPTKYGVDSSCVSWFLSRLISPYNIELASWNFTASL